MSVQQDNLQDSYLKNGIIYISEQITQEYVDKIIKQLHYVNSIMNLNNPIKIYVSSGGGFAIPALSILNIMNVIKKKRIIETYNISQSCSAACYILSNGTHGSRYTFDNSFIMNHSVRSHVSYTDSEDKEIGLKRSECFEEMLYKIFSENTGKKISEIKKDFRRDKWFTAKEAKEYGIVDHIIERNDLTQESYQQKLKTGLNNNSMM